MKKNKYIILHKRFPTNRDVNRDNRKENCLKQLWRSHRSRNWFCSDEKNVWSYSISLSLTYEQLHQKISLISEQQRHLRSNFRSVEIGGRERRSPFNHRAPLRFWNTIRNWVTERTRAELFSKFRLQPIKTIYYNEHQLLESNFQ